ncbi:MAG: SUMF1/EgtB/PvdO family nonheme iron enzyme [Myxococcota bacterium]
MASLRTLLLPLILAACTSEGAPDDTADTSVDEVPPAIPLAVPGTLVDIPSGPFVMGCDTAAHPECNGDEAPVHTVELSAFRIEVTEVTVAQWQECRDAFGCPELSGEVGAADEPMVGMTVDRAEGYCRWKERRLPTEAEWERAARGPEGGLYPWGDDAPDCDRAASRMCDGGLVPVSTHPAGMTAEGVYDMAGNAWEWVSDGYDADFYASSSTTDPEGQAPGGQRVVRGPDGWADLTVLRSTNREMAIPDGASALVGFRCVEAE